MLSDPKNGKIIEQTPLLQPMTYEDWLKLKKYRLRSLETLLSLQRSLLKYLDDFYLQLNKENLLSYAHYSLEQGYSLRYEKQIQWGLKRYFEYLKMVHGFKGKLMLPKLELSKSRREALKKEELEQLHKWLDKNHSPLRELLFVLFYGCGLRRSEALGLKIKDVKPSRKLLEVETRKGGKVRRLPLSSQQLQAIYNYVEQERPEPKQGFKSRLLVGKQGGKANGLIGSELLKWQEGSGLGQRFCWHVLRHTIATKLVNSGMSLELVASFLGHQSISSTAHYLHHQKAGK